MIKLANKNLLILFFLLGMISQFRPKNLVDSLETQRKTEQALNHRLKLISNLIKKTLREDIEQAKIYIDRYHLEASQVNILSEEARSCNFYGM